MEKFSTQKLERLIKERDYNYKSLSLKAGLGETAIRDIIVGRTKNPRTDTLKKIALALGEPLSALEDYDPDDMWKTVLVVGSVSAGRWEEGRHGKITHMIPFRSRRNSLIGLSVEGQSMNRYAAEGQAIVVDIKDVAPNDNDLVVARCNDQYTFKRFRANPRRLEPFSTEPDYQPIYYTDDECVILGKVLGAATPIKIDEII